MQDEVKIYEQLYKEGKKDKCWQFVLNVMEKQQQVLGAEEWELNSQRADGFVAEQEILVIKSYLAGQGCKNALVKTTFAVFKGITMNQARILAWVTEDVEMPLLAEE